MEDTTYLFIDHGYLKLLYKDKVRKVLGEALTLDFWAIRRGASARRVYFYDCVDNAKKKDEKDEDFALRVEEQELFLAGINSLEGFHVREGYLSPGKKRQQKEVDVLLAVDMMEHSFARNMTRAVLISGDRDFKPVVESVARAGTFVEVWNERGSSASELGRAADVHRELGIVKLVEFTYFEPGESRNKYFPAMMTVNPAEASNQKRHMNSGALLVKTGTIQSKSRTLEIYHSHWPRKDSPQHSYSVLLKKGHAIDHQFHDEKVLSAFVEAEYGPITWPDHKIH